MAQIFTPAADTAIRVTMLLGVSGLIVAIALIGGFVNSAYMTWVKWPVDQPVPFSHQHHVGGLGLDCRFCHTTVETSANAGFPPTHTCMTCHSQIWTGAPMLAPVRRSFASGKPIAWHRVARVPDYVFFNHAIHVNRGVPCVECHGRVDKMPLLARAKPFQMSWCLSCHRDPAPHLRPRDQVTRMDWTNWREQYPNFDGARMVQAYGIDTARLIGCDTCHR